MRKTLPLEQTLLNRSATLHQIDCISLGQTTVVIEAEVHSFLRAFLREQDEPRWQHHLTMARLVARALRLGRSALIQTGGVSDQYRLSYLTSALLWKEAVIIVASETVQEKLLTREIPQLQIWLETNKPISRGDRFGKDFQGIFLTSTTNWLGDRLQSQGRFPPDIPTIIDSGDDLEELVREQLTAHLHPEDWQELICLGSSYTDLIRDVQVKLTKAIFSHPVNPYECYLLDTPEQEQLQQLLTNTTGIDIGLRWQAFWQRWQQGGQLLWASVMRAKGQFSLHCAPIPVAEALNPIWRQQPVVIIGSFLDSDSSASVYRQQLGLEDLTSVKFSPDRQGEAIQLYLPDTLPMPNTPQFQGVLMQQLRSLISLRGEVKKPIVLLVEDVPLKARVGAILAAEFGSRVQVEKTALANNGILVSGWEFWRSHSHLIPPPQLLVMATLPFPSLEHPLVAGHVSYYKSLRKDWFRLYLLPTALRKLQQAIAPIRRSQGVVALLDNRVNHRSYGNDILNALEPFARINYLSSLQEDWGIEDWE